MLRPSLAIFLSALVLSLRARGAPPGKEATPGAPTASASPAADAAQVREHVTRGEKARRANRWSEAIEAYEAGLLAVERAGLSVEERYPILAEIVICEVARGNYASAGNQLARLTARSASVNSRASRTASDGFRLYQGADCSNALYSSMVDDQVLCSDVPGGIQLRSMKASWLVNDPGTCMPTGGVAVGEVVPKGPTIFCCQPPP